MFVGDLSWPPRVAPCTRLIDETRAAGVDRYAAHRHTACE
jgi:hypothetical protein